MKGLTTTISAALALPLATPTAGARSPSPMKCIAAYAEIERADRRALVVGKRG